MHIYEPVPQYYASLEKVWAEHVRTNNWAVEVHQYGLGDATKTIHLSEADLQGQGTFGMKETERNDTKKIKLDIVDAATAFNNVTGEDLDFFHVNCEGCEYEMLENMINFNLHKKIKYSMNEVSHIKLNCVLSQNHPVRDPLLPPGDPTDREVLQDQGGAGQDPQDGLRRSLRLGEMGQEDLSKPSIILLLDDTMYYHVR